MTEPFDAVTLAFDRSSLARRPLLTRHLRTSSSFDVPDLRDDVRALAIRAWEDRIQAEYIGVMVVRHFHGLLVDVNAPMDLQEIALVMMLQEQQHAALCRDAAVALGSTAEITVPIEELQFQRQNDPATELLEMVVGTYAVGEATALALLRHAIGALPESDFRGVLVQIAADEGLHGRIGSLMLDEMRTADWFEWPGDSAVREVFERHRTTMAQRDVIEPDEAELFEDPHTGTQLRSVGIPDSREFLAAYHQALTSVTYRP